MDGLAAGRKRIDVIAKRAAKNRYKTGYRSHRIHRRSMSLDKQRIRIDGEQCRHGKHVSGRFQYPTPSRPSKTQMLKKPVMVFVHRPQILLKKPGAI